MQSTTVAGRVDAGEAGHWWAATLFSAFATPIGFAWAAPPDAAQTLPPGAATEFRAIGAAPRRVSDRELCESAKQTERLRLAQQIHDDLGGVLTGIRACLAVSLERAAQSGVAPAPLLADAYALAELAFDAMRQIATDAHPPMLDRLGVWGALDWHLSKLARRSRMHCELRVDPSVAALDLCRERELTIFRIVLEALTNVERHACAWELSVLATCTATALCVTVADDGVGIADGEREAGYDALGIRGMRDRADALGGHLSVLSQHNKGTSVQLTLPLRSGDGD